MSGKAFVDTNILIYAHDVSNPAKQQRAIQLIDQLWDERRGVVSTQVLQELAANVRRSMRNRLSMAQATRLVESFLAWEVVINQPKAVLRAMEIEERFQISFWDAMIVQAAQSAGCEILYSEDLSHGQEYDGVLVVNPFAA
jgi:predicted nucleic acid-binding protein